MTAEPFLKAELPGLPVRHGKVRDVFDLGDRLLLVSTDRISAFDWILPGGIPDKGRVLNSLSAWWFAQSAEAHHVLSTDPADFGLPATVDPRPLAGRALLAKKTDVIPIECVVRGYLAGSGWKEYRANRSVCGVALPPGLVEGAMLPEPIFTPATKVNSPTGESGGGAHDENIAFSRMVDLIGQETAEELRRRSLALYHWGAAIARERGIIIADTKFEWGRLPDGGIILIDEILTPDSSRFWPRDDYQPGHAQASYDKQYVRDWLESSGWDKNSPPPPLPAGVVAQTREKYIQAFERLTGGNFPWK
ncbi:MAG: phosphoribosylaminoimidazolesuccinocarboxamide synthase [Pirellulales bacterium]|nr:phosphoribosylaminoimidazolesuccinocarboxamide synthase [Pirellulales bacterium]